jgi:hypothetical protein
MSPPFLAARLALLWCLVLLAGCTDAYLPDEIKAPPGYLVVDGFLNSQGTTTIKLSRTFALASKAAAPAETKATAYVEEEGGPRYLLREAPLGTYTSAALTLNPAKRYRLHLTTQGGKEYASDYVPAKTTPAMRVEARPESTELAVYVNARDPANTTHYYRWEYDETWEIRPLYAPTMEYVNRAMRYIVVPFPRACWGNAPSTAVKLYSTTSLSQDVVSDFQVNRLPTNSERLHNGYSILVRQYALTKEEYDYWELLRKNTEAIGSLYDPQPVQLTGNVRCLNGPDPALGCVGAHSLVEQRIFVRPQDVPAAWKPLSGYEKCARPDSISLYPRGIIPPPKPEEILYAAFGDPSYLPITSFEGTIPGATGFYGAPRDCIDCRTRGTAAKPSFWP